MGIRGDFAGLRKMRADIKALSSSATKAELSKVLMMEALDLIDEGFATSTAPDGSPWEPLALRSGQPLRDTRRLQGSFTGTSSAQGFQVGTNVMYAPTHQHGATIKAKRGPRLHFSVGGRHFSPRQVTIPARPMLPEGSSISGHWRLALTEAAQEYVARKMRR